MVCSPLRTSISVDGGQRPGPCGVGPGVRGAGDDVRGPVREQDAPSGELIDRLAGWQPGRQTRRRAHRGMPGRAQRGARSHRMPDQDDRNRPELAADLVQQPAQISYRGGLRVVPAAKHEPGPAHRHCLAAHRVPDGGGQRDHPEHGQLIRGGGFGAHRLAAVRDDHHAPD